MPIFETETSRVRGRNSRSAERFATVTSKIFTSLSFIGSDYFGDRHREMCRIILKEIRCEEEDWINPA